MAISFPSEKLPGPVCNIADAGRRRRRTGAYISSAITIIVLGGFMAMQLPWFWRLLLGLPAASAATGFLQARRSVCIARAAEGTIEGEGFSTTKAASAELVEHRRVAWTIVRDSVLIGVAAALIGAASAFIR